MLSTTEDRMRILAVYREMPGLRLTVEQTSRLCGIEPEPCAMALRALVKDGLLGARDRHFVVRDES